MEMATKIMAKLKRKILIGLLAVMIVFSNNTGITEELKNNESYLPRVASLNLCADAYLMAFAKSEQILSLTQQSSDPTLSAFAKEASNFPISSDRLSTSLKVI